MTDEDDDFRDDEDEEEQIPARKPPQKRRPPIGRIPVPPKLPDEPAEPDENEALIAHQAIHQQRLIDLYTKPIPRGLGRATGIEGYDEEYEIITRAGIGGHAQLIFSRMLPRGPDGKPVDLGSMIPDQFRSGQELFDYLYENYAQPEREVVIQWKLYDRTVLRYGDMRLPIKRAAPRRERVDGGSPPNAGMSGSPPPWGPSSHGYHPQQQGWPSPYPPQPPAPPPAQQAAPPQPAPPPPGTPPEAVAYINVLRDQIKTLQDRLFSTPPQQQQPNGELAELRQQVSGLAGRVEQLLQFATQPQQQPASAAPAPQEPPKPRSFTDELDEMEAKVGALERIKKRLSPEAPPVQSQAPAAEPEGAKEDPRPFYIERGGDGIPDVIYDKDGNMKTGDTLFRNIGMLQTILGAVAEKFSAELIKVKQAPAHAENGAQQGQPKTMTSGAGKNWGK